MWIEYFGYRFDLMKLQFIVDLYHSESNVFVLEHAKKAPFTDW